MKIFFLINFTIFVLLCLNFSLYSSIDLTDPFEYNYFTYTESSFIQLSEKKEKSVISKLEEEGFFLVSDLPLSAHLFDSNFTFMRINKELNAPSPDYKVVYLQLRELHRIRDKGVSQGEALSADVEDLIQDKFREVDRVTEELLTQLFDNIEDCIELSLDDPISLVSTLQVVEMEDRSEMFKMFPQFKKMREACMQRIEAYLAEIKSEDENNEKKTHFKKKLGS